MLYRIILSNLKCIHRLQNNITKIKKKNGKNLLRSNTNSSPSIHPAPNFLIAIYPYARAFSHFYRTQLSTLNWHIVLE